MPNSIRLTGFLCLVFLGGMLIFVQMGCRPSVMRQSITVATLRDIRSALFLYQSRNEETYPKDISVLIADVSNPGSQYDFPQWRKFHYVAVLTTNDPPRTPVVLYLPDRQEDGMALLRNGHILFFNDLALQSYRNIKVNPWSYVRHSFDAEQDYDNFRQRLTLLPPLQSHSSEEP